MSVLGEKRHLLAHQYSQRWRQLQRIRSPKTAARDLPNVRLPSILHSEGLFLPGLERKHTARFFGAARATLQTGVSQATRALTANRLDKNSRP